MKKLIKSYSFWTALAGAVGFLVVSLGKVFNINIASESIEQIIMGICGVLVVFGVVPKPKKENINEINIDNKSNDDQADQK